jgi:predicted nucleotidyltransferase
VRARVPIDQDEVAAFCRRHGVRRLALFGSVLSDDFTPASDVDTLVEFEAVSALTRKRGNLNHRHAD